MCFSPTASFTASAALTITGILTLKVSAKHELLFASIPLLFAAQQFIEGVIWLILLHNGSAIAEYWLAQSYAVFVGIIWPILVPFSIWMIEPEHRRKNMMLGAISIGGGIAVFTLYSLVKYPVTSHIKDYCISYDYPVAQPHSLLVLYVIAISGAFFCSSNRAIIRLGWVNMITFLIAYYFYRYDLASVWCFFAAIISILIYLYCDQRAEFKTKPYKAA